MDLRARVGTVICALVFTSAAVLGLLKAIAADAARVHTVVIEAMRFEPHVVRINPGDRVVFVNKDIFPHTATRQGERDFDSGLIKPGESWTVRPAANQTIHYACRYHPSMEGQIVVARP